MLYIVVTGYPNEYVLREVGCYATMFLRRLRAAGYLGPAEVYEAIEGRLPDIALLRPEDTILLTGSKSDAWSDEPWILRLLGFVEQVLAGGIGSGTSSGRGVCGIIGICFGHQIVARALGAKMGPAGHWEASHCEIEFTEAGKTVFPQLGERAIIGQMHRDAVLELPVGTELLASSALCPIQGFYARHRLLCLQGHPEFSKPVVTLTCKVRFADDEPFRQDALARAENAPEQGPEFCESLVRFIAQTL